MSERIKAGDILTEAFRFGFYRWPTVLRFGWAPFALALLVTLGAVFSVIDFAAAEALDNAAEPTWDDFKGLLRVPPGVALLALIAAGFATMLLYCGFFASVYRLAALGEERPGLVQLRFDGPALRVFAALLILNLINYAVIVALCVVMLAVNGFGFGDFIAAWPEVFSLIERSAGDPSYQPSPEDVQRFAPIGAFFTGLFVAAPVLMYLNVKLLPFAPGSAAENRLLLLGAFRMTSGHAWSIFGTLILFALAMVVISILYVLTMSFIELMAALGGSFAAVGMIFSAISFAAGAAYQIFIMGVQLSLQAIIYRRLRTGE